MSVSLALRLPDKKSEVSMYGDCVLRPDCSDGASHGKRSGKNGEEMLGITLGRLPVKACG